MFGRVSLSPSEFHVEDDQGNRWKVSASRVMGDGRTLIRLSLFGGELPTRQELEEGNAPIFLVAERGDLVGLADLQDSLTDFIVGCIREGLVDSSRVTGSTKDELSQSLVEAIRDHFASLAFFTVLDPERGSHESFMAFMSLSDEAAS